MVHVVSNGRTVLRRENARIVQIDRSRSVASPGRFNGRCVAVTSLNPNPKRMQRQLKCLASWVRIGLPVVAVNTSAELQQFSLPDGVFGAPCESLTTHYDRQTQFVASLIMIGQQNGIPFLLINSDIEIIGSGDLIDEALTHTDQLTIGIRHNHLPGEKQAKREPHGLDAFLMTPEMASTIPADAPFGIGKPAWDYWLPEHFRSLGYGFHWIRQPLFFHELHQIGWTHSEWETGRDFIRDRYGIALGYGSREFRRGLNQHRTADVAEAH